MLSLVSDRRQPKDDHRADFMSDSLSTSGEMDT